MLETVLFLGGLALVAVFMLLFLGIAIMSARKQARKLARSKAQPQKEIVPWSL